MSRSFEADVLNIKERIQNGEIIPLGLWIESILPSSSELDTALTYTVLIEDDAVYRIGCERVANNTREVYQRVRSKQRLASIEDLEIVTLSHRILFALEFKLADQQFIGQRGAINKIRDFINGFDVNIAETQKILRIRE